MTRGFLKGLGTSKTIYLTPRVLYLGCNTIMGYRNKEIGEREEHLKEEEQILGQGCA